MEDFSLADVAAATRGNNGDWGGSSAWVLIILFALIFGWGRNGFGNSNTDTPVNEAGLCNAMNFNNLENSVGRLNDQLQSQNLMMADRIAALNADNAQRMSAMQAQIDNCWCTTQRAIDNVGFNMSQQIQKVIDAVTQNKIDAMQNQINELQLSQALQGVVRYPNGYTYTAGNNPFCGNTPCNI